MAGAMLMRSCVPVVAVSVDWYFLACATGYGVLTVLTSARLCELKAENHILFGRIHCGLFAACPFGGEWNMMRDMRTARW